MEKELLKHLINYYSQLDKTDKKWEEFRKLAEKPFLGLRNQTEQFRSVTSNDIGEIEIFKLEGARDKLTSKILSGIEDEVAIVKNILSDANNVNQDLRNKLTRLESARSKASMNDEAMQELVNGTMHRPPLNVLLEWAVDGCDYYSKLYLRVKVCLANVDYKKEKTIEEFAGSFRQSSRERIKIERILGTTQFLAKETCR